MRIAAFALVPVLALLAGCGAGTAAKPVPDLSRRPLDEAESSLDDLGLQYRAIGGGALGIVVRSRWVVCSQRPLPGKKAQRVLLYVERFCPLERPAVVPEVEGENVAEARERLESLGFFVDAYNPDADDDDEILVEHLWEVCEQYPAAGKRASTVSLEASHDCG